MDLVPAAKKRTTNVAKLRVLARENMLEALSRVAEFRRYDARRKDCVTTDPPGPVVALLLQALRGLKVDRKIYIHINNTNPILIEGSPERQAVEAAGYEIAYDGMELAL